MVLRLPLIPFAAVFPSSAILGEVHSSTSSMSNAVAPGPLQTAGLMDQLLSKGGCGWGLWLLNLLVVEASSVQSLIQMCLTKGCGLGPGQL